MSLSPEERAARAVRISALLDDEDIKNGLASIEAEIVEEWRRTQDPHERENLWRAINIMERLVQWMRSAASHDMAALRRTGAPPKVPY